MAEVVKEVHEKDTGNTLLTWLALIVATLALILAWMAYNRTGTDLETRIRNQVNESVDNTQQQLQ